MNPLNWNLTDTTDQKKAVKALREGRKIVKTGPLVIYKFPSGKWSWAIPRSPIGELLRSEGQIYMGVPAERWFQVDG